nr:2536_t:CDS:2 [Entrophospora candida]
MPVLSELAAKLMSIPALLAGAEINWSHFGFVHRLPDDRKGKTDAITGSIKRGWTKKRKNSQNLWFISTSKFENLEFAKINNTNFPKC